MANDAFCVAFARLVAYSKPLRGWKLMLEEKPHYTRGYLRDQMLNHGIAELPVDASPLNTSKAGDYHRAWLEKVRQWFGLPPQSGSLGSMSYLFFGDVESHVDGTQRVYDAGPYHGQEAVFLNIHLHGRGRLNVTGSSFRIGPGDAYVLDQKAEHGFTNEQKLPNKAVSFLVPRSLVPELLRTSSSPQATLAMG